MDFNPNNLNRHAAPADGYNNGLQKAQVMILCNSLCQTRWHYMGRLSYLSSQPPVQCKLHTLKLCLQAH